MTGELTREDELELSTYLVTALLAWLEPRMQELRQSTLAWFFATESDADGGSAPARVDGPDAAPPRKKARKRR